MRGRHFDVEQVDDFSRGGGNLDGAVGAIQVLTVPRRKRGAVKAHLQGFWPGNSDLVAADASRLPSDDAGWRSPSR